MSEVPALHYGQSLAPSSLRPVAPTFTPHKVNILPFPPAHYPSQFQHQQPLFQFQPQYHAQLLGQAHQPHLASYPQPMSQLQPVPQLHLPVYSPHFYSQPDVQGQPQGHSRSRQQQVPQDHQVPLSQAPHRPLSQPLQQAEVHPQNPQPTVPQNRPLQNPPQNSQQASRTRKPKKGPTLQPVVASPVRVNHSVCGTVVFDPGPRVGDRLKFDYGDQSANNLALFPHILLVTNWKFNCSTLVFGKKKSREKAVDCINREFAEETGIPSSVLQFTEQDLCPGFVSRFHMDLFVKKVSSLQELRFLQSFAHQGDLENFGVTIVPICYELHEDGMIERFPLYLACGSFRGKMGDAGSEIMAALYTSGCLSKGEISGLFNLATQYLNQPPHDPKGALWCDIPKRKDYLRMMKIEVFSCELVPPIQSPASSLSSKLELLPKLMSTVCAHVKGMDSAAANAWLHDLVVRCTPAVEVSTPSTLPQTQIAEVVVPVPSAPELPTILGAQVLDPASQAPVQKPRVRTSVALLPTPIILETSPRNRVRQPPTTVVVGVSPRSKLMSEVKSGAAAPNNLHVSPPGSPSATTMLMRQNSRSPRTQPVSIRVMSVHPMPGSPSAGTPIHLVPTQLVAPRVLQPASSRDLSDNHAKSELLQRQPILADPIVAISEGLGNMSVV